MRFKIAVFAYLLSLCLAELNVQISTNQGEIQGVRKVARNGDEFVAFYGIPYAQPPLGDLRFAPPKPHQGWKSEENSIRDATTNDVYNECWQIEAFE